MWKTYIVFCGENIEQEENSKGDKRKRTDRNFNIQSIPFSSI